ncbi:hypothetical protein ABZP36_018336 [Zizania latifolia]
MAGATSTAVATSSTSDAPTAQNAAPRMMARGQDKAHHGQVAVRLLLQLLPVPEFGRSLPCAAGRVSVCA